MWIFGFPILEQGKNFGYRRIDLRAWSNDFYQNRRKGEIERSRLWTGQSVGIGDSEWFRELSW